MTSCYILIINTMLYIKEDKTVVQQISDAELEIMKIVWGNPEDVTLFPYIMDRLAARGKPCQKNTLIVLLSRLMNKGFLSAKKIGRRNEYTTLVSEAEYQTAQTKNFLDKIYEGSAKGLVSNLIMGDLLADEEYEELKRLLEKGKGQQ
ncbi:penicillinase repressor [Lachnospiraceae bacterium]|nr:penicillinase repressor [Lachnospiraceae bacterium]